MIFPEVLGHEHARTVLARLLASNRLPHAFLFHGPEGVGKGLVARMFATSLVCTEPRSDATACGTCSACRKASHGNHPDVLVVTRLPKSDARVDTGAENEEDDGDDGSPARSGELKPFIIGMDPFQIETISQRLIISSVMVLGGIGLALLGSQGRHRPVKR